MFEKCEQSGTTEKNVLLKWIEQGEEMKSKNKWHEQKKIKRKIILKINNDHRNIKPTVN